MLMRTVSLLTVNLSNKLDHENFNRVQKLKEIIFDVNQDKNGFVNFEELLGYFTLKNTSINLEQNQGKTYYDLLFF
jgi:hypothetical protein